MEITLFTDDVRCHHCNQLDQEHELKKYKGRWFCQKCFQQSSQLT